MALFAVGVFFYFTGNSGGISCKVKSSANDAHPAEKKFAL